MDTLMESGGGQLRLVSPPRIRPLTRSVISMKTKQAGSSTVVPAAALAVFLLLLVVLSSYFIVEKTWWLPDPINEQGQSYDVQFTRTLWLVGLIFLFAQLALAYVVLRYRGRGGKSDYSHGNNKLEVLWTTATAVLFLGLGIAGESSWANLHFKGAAPDAMKVEVLAKQFAWNFRYSGPDGVFGRTDPSLIDDALGNPFGLDYDDPAARDDVVAPVLGVPVDQEVELTLNAQDVTHSFFVRELRLKQDVVPGLRVRIHFTAREPGSYEIACAELCGLQHNTMKSSLRVVSRGDFEKFLKDFAPFTEDESSAIEGDE